MTDAEKTSWPVRAREWLWFHIDWVVGSALFLLSLIVALASASIRDQGREVLFVNAGLSVGVLTAALAALAVMVVFLAEEFIIILEEAEGGIGGAFRPYIEVSLACAASILIAIAGALVYPAALSHLQAFILAISMGSLTTAITGVAQIVEVTVFFGRQRGQQSAGMHTAKEHRNRRIRDSA